jgi:hypothetical protein
MRTKMHRTIILPAFLFGCETCCLTLRREHKLRVCQNRKLGKIFGPKRDKVTGEWRRLPEEELHNLYSSPNIIRVIRARRMRWAGHAASMPEMRQERNRPLERLRRRR